MMLENIEFGTCLAKAKMRVAQLIPSLIDEAVRGEGFYDSVIL